MQELTFESSAYPVLRVEEDDKARIVATCTLVRTFDEEHFLINASHALCKDRWGNNLPIFICFPGQTLKLTQKYPFGDTIKTKNDENDFLDIAITHIIPSFIKKHQLASFPLFNDFPHQSYSHLSQRILYFGYPYSRSSIDFKKRNVKAHPILYISKEVLSLRENLQSFYNFSLSDNILSTYSRRKIRNQNRFQQKFQESMSAQVLTS